MIRFSRILFPVDLSKQSRETAPFVIAMVARFSSKLIVLHVVSLESNRSCRSRQGIV
jgi:hypothetical protein